jgi:hypothetical protein
MIGGSRIRSALFAATATIAVLALFGARSPHLADADAPRVAAQEAMLFNAGSRADAALAALEAALASALDDARSGAALVLAGDEPPDARFDAAATELEDAVPGIPAVRSALEDVRRAAASNGEAPAVPQPPIDETSLLRLAADLRATGTSGAAVASLRHASDAVLEDLDTALAASAAGQPDAVKAAVDDARSRLPEVEGWHERLPTLPVWTSGMRSLLDALDGIAAALRSGDDTALADALATYRRATQDADRADRGLAIALADGASTVSGAASGVAPVLDAVRECRAAVASVVLGGGREGAAS